MRQTDFYVLRRLLVALGAAVGAICPLLLLATALRFVDDIVDRGLGLEPFAALVALALPHLLGAALPFALLIAILIVYQRLEADSELIAMRAAGAGHLRLAAPGLALALAVMGLVAWNGLVLAPASERQIRELGPRAKQGFSVLMIRPGVFREIEPGMTLFVRERHGEGDYAGILLQDDRDAERRVTYLAERGAVSTTGPAPRLVATGVSRQTVERATGRLAQVQFDRYSIDLALPEEAARPRSRRERSLGELLNPVAEEVGLRNVGKFRAEGHYRLASGLMPGAVAVTALVCMLLGGRGRLGRAFRPTLATVLCFGLLVASYAVKAAVARTPALAGLQYLVGAAPILAGLMLLSVDVRRPRPADR